MRGLYFWCAAFFDINMIYSKKFLKFIEIWQEDFAIARSMDEKVCVDKKGNPLPWYTYPAIEYLSQFDYHDKTVFEFGCGYSSLFWADRAKKVVSVEDNADWLQKWQNEFYRENLSLLFRTEGEAYYQSILEDSTQYDVIVIDGKNREECALSAIKALKKGGMIILDDSDRVNTSKEYYQAIQALKSANLLQIDFYGFCPLDNYPKTTSLFLSRDFNFDTTAPIQPINGIGNLWGMGRKRRKEFYNSNK